MDTTRIGRDAESYVAEQLGKRGFKLLDQNWRTRYCEIDLVMQKASIVYFIEVKFRSNTDYGSGLEYITPKKLSQMQFAAEMWLAAHPRVGKGSTLAAVAVSPSGSSVELVELS